MLHPNILNARSRDRALELIQRGHYDQNEAGLFVPDMGLRIAGHFETSVNGGPWEVSPNLVVTEGLNHILSVALGQGTQKSAFYIAPYSGNVTILAAWNASNFASNTTEFTNYDESTRVLWQDDAVAAGVINNNTNPAVFTIGSGGGTIRGAGLLEISTKSATTGVLICAANFSTAKTLAEDDELRIKYGITATST